MQTALGASHSQRLTGTLEAVGFKGEKPVVCISHSGKLCYRAISHWNNLTQGNVNLTQEQQFWTLFFCSVLCSAPCFAAQHMQPMLRIQPFGLEVCSLKDLTQLPGPKPPPLSESVQIWLKTSKQVLCPLSTVVSSTDSSFPASQSTDERAPSPPLSCPFHSLLAHPLQPPVLYRPLDVLPL